MVANQPQTVKSRQAPLFPFSNLVLVDIEQAFIKVMDELVVEAQEGSDLAEGIKWIDTQAHENGIAFYEMALIILRKHLAERNARAWLLARQS